ncbi:hypothetical protein AB0K16_04425 [Nonomuraea jabiensis]|uniref:hypothetical protein n=1 Tax=Nonomuraea jabiensis TaxID=882448 RepID=UPI00343731F6
MMRSCAVTVLLGLVAGTALISSIVWPGWATVLPLAAIVGLSGSRITAAGELAAGRERDALTDAGEAVECGTRPRTRRRRSSAAID